PLARRPSALELFVDGLAGADSLLPPHSGYAALRRQLARWVYDGLGRLARASQAPWKLSLHLDERTVGGETELVLEPWLQAEDDPTLSLPASLLWHGSEDIFSFLRAGDAREDFTRQLAELEPLLAEHGIRLDGVWSAEAKLDVDAA